MGRVNTLIFVILMAYNVIRVGVLPERMTPRKRVTLMGDAQKGESHV